MKLDYLAGPRNSVMQRAGPERNPNIRLDALVEALLDPIGRRARQQALEASRSLSGQGINAYLAPRAVSFSGLLVP